MYTVYIVVPEKYVIIITDIKVMGESSIEIFATKNKVVYVSPTVHVSNKLTRAKYSY